MNEGLTGLRGPRAPWETAERQGDFSSRLCTNMLKEGLRRRQSH